MTNKNLYLVCSILALIVFSLILVSAYDCSSAPAGCSVSGNDLVCDLIGNADRVAVDNFATNAGANLANSPFIYTYKNNYGKGSILYKINTLIDTGANNIFLSLFFNRTWIDGGSYYPGNPTKDVLQVGKLINNWNQNTVTWNNKPGFDSIYSETVIDQSQASMFCSKVGVACIAQVGQFINFDITDVYRDWVSGANNYGLYISSKYGDYANPSGLAEASGNFFNKNGKIVFEGVCNTLPPTCTDNDIDGYSVEGGLCGAIDCNDNNALIHPNAAEICGNLIDDNCNGQIDEGCPFPPTNCTANSNETQTCGSNIGACAFGTQIRFCSSTGQWGAWSVCSGEISPITEICGNLIDDNCNGQIDEPGCINDSTPPIISNLVITKTSNSASIFFSTDEPADHTINYGTSQALGNIISNPAFLTTHIILLNNLINNTLYYYNLTVCDSSGNCAVSQGSFTTDTIQTETIHEDHYITKKTKEIVYSGLSEETGEETTILRSGTTEPLILTSAEEKAGVSWLFIFLIILFGLLIILLIILIIWAYSY